MYEKFIFSMYVMYEKFILSMYEKFICKVTL